jgi:hypothetical protein
MRARSHHETIKTLKGKQFSAQQRAILSSWLVPENPPCWSCLLAGWGCTSFWCACLAVVVEGNATALQLVPNQCNCLALPCVATALQPYLPDLIIILIPSFLQIWHS